MHFIGIFANNLEFENIKQNVMKITKREDLKLINIHSKNISNMKNIVFETIVFCKEIDVDKDQKDIVEKTCRSCEYIIINSDITNTMEILPNKKVKCVTFGLNQKATITISSVQDEKAIVAIQRNIENLEGKKIELGEYEIKLYKFKNIQNLLAIASIFSIYYL